MTKMMRVVKYMDVAGVVSAMDAMVYPKVVQYNGKATGSMRNVKPARSVEYPTVQKERRRTCHEGSFARSCGMTGVV